MRHRERAELLEWTDDLRSMLDTMQDSHLIVGMRLHACILGLALGRPVVALPYDVKVDEFVSQEPSVRAVRTEVLRDPDRLAELILGSLSQPDATAAPRYRWADSELSQLRLGAAWSLNTRRRAWRAGARGPASHRRRSRTGTDCAIACR